MLKQVSHINVWVHDQDEALAFYRDKLGFEVRNDVKVDEMGDFRWLTVGPPGQPDVNLILSVPGPPALERDAGRQVAELVAAGAVSGPGVLIFETDDIEATHAELSGRGVEFIQEPMERPYGIDAAFRDPSGNAFRVAQRVEAPATR